VLYIYITILGRTFTTLPAEFITTSGTYYLLHQQE